MLIQAFKSLRHNFAKRVRGHSALYQGTGRDLVPGVGKEKSCKWWPTHGPAADHVQVKVRDRVPRVLADVEDQAIPRIGDAIGGGDRLGGHQHVGQDLRVGGADHPGMFDVAFRNHQHMGGRRRVEVTKGQAVVGFVNLGGRNFPGNYSTEDACSGHGRHRI